MHGKTISLGFFHFRVSRALQSYMKKMLFFFIITLSAALIFLSKQNNSYVNKARTATTDIMAPFLTNFSKPVEWSNDIFKEVRGHFAVYDKNKKLEAEREIYKKQLVHLKHLEMENKELKKLLNFSRQEEYFILVAKIISRSSYIFKRTVVINAGRSSGVENNMPVMSDKGLIGRVTEAGENSSYVLLITDVSSNIPVIVLDSGESAILSGSGNNSLFLKYFQSDFEVLKNSQIVTSGDGGFFPASLSIGSVHSQKNGKVYVKTYNNISKLTYVGVLMDADLTK